MHDPLEPFIEEIERECARVLEGLGYTDEWSLLFPRKGEGRGDRALPCHKIAKILSFIGPDQWNRLEIADEISKRYQATGSEAFPENGFVNFIIDGSSLNRSVFSSLIEMGDRYGGHPPSGRSVLVEHTSANPNGPLHVGRTRNPIIGDTIVRLLRWAGDEVTAEYYVNDIGKQVAILVWGYDNLALAEADQEQKEDHVRVKYYQKANAELESNPGIEGEIEALITAVESGDESAIARFREIIGPVLEGMLGSLERLNIHFDSFVHESSFIQNGSVDTVIEGLRESSLCSDDEGALFLDMEGLVHGRNPRFVFTRASGTSLYTTRDVAYHIDKLSRSDHLIDILGEDHKLQAQQLALALGELGQEGRPELVFYAFVTLPEGKMSTRKARVVYMDDLVEEAVERAREEVRARRPEIPKDQMEEIAEAVGVGSIRYNIIRVQAEKKITFRWEDALNFDGDSAPFIQYTHARASSILRKAGSEGALFTFEPDEDESRLIRMIAGFPSTIRSSAVERKPHKLTGFLHEFAMAFNAFYRDCKVIGDDREAGRLALVNASRIVLGNGLEALGIPHPDEI